MNTKKLTLALLVLCGSFLVSGSALAETSTNATISEMSLKRSSCSGIGHGTGRFCWTVCVKGKCHQECRPYRQFN